MEEKTTYECNICHIKYTSKELAMDCEKKCKKNQNLPPAIDDISKMPTIKYGELRKLRKKDKPNLEVYFCNECGTPDSVAIFCCPVNGDATKDLAILQDV